MIYKVVKTSLVGAIAVLTILSNAKETQAQYRTPPPPPDAPESARGGGDRSYCPALGSDVDITPVIPVASGWGTTATASPTVWINLAYDDATTQTLPPAEIYVLDRVSGDVVGEVEALELPEKAGTFGRLLPQLPTENTWYEWYVKLDCSPVDDPDNFSYLEVGGLIYYDKTLGDGAIVNASDRQQQILFYEEKGVWYDLFSQLAMQQCEAEAESGEMASSSKLASLLTAGGLETIRAESVICPMLSPASGSLTSSNFRPE